MEDAAKIPLPPGTRLNYLAKVLLKYDRERAMELIRAGHPRVLECPPNPKPSFEEFLAVVKDRRRANMQWVLDDLDDKQPRQRRQTPTASPTHIAPDTTGPSQPPPPPPQPPRTPPPPDPPTAISDPQLNDTAPILSNMDLEETTMYVTPPIVAVNGVV